MTDRLELPRRYRDQLEALLREHVPGVEVWAYGSRVNGESHDGSDLDLVLRGPTLEPLDGGFYDLLEAIEKSNIPILVQAHDWAMLPESFHREIERGCVVVQEGAKQTAASGWREVRLGDVMSFANGTSSPERSADSLYPVYGSNGIIGKSNEVNADANTIVIGRVGSYCGSLHFSNENCWITDNAIRAKAVGENDSKFFLYLLQSLGLNEWRSGSGQPLLNQTILSSIPTALPPLPTQRAIAHVLGTLDDKIELNRRMNETLEEMARKLFKSWFVDFEPVRAKMEGRWRRGESLPGLPAKHYDLFPGRLVDSELGEIPEGWEVKALEKLVELAYGKALRAVDRKDGSVPVYGSNGQVGWHDKKLVAGPGIVVGRKGNPGVVTWTHDDFFPIDTTFYVVPRDANGGLPFLLFALTDQDLPFVSADSAVPGLNRNLAYMNKQLMPDKHVLAEFDDYASAIFSRCHRLEEESRALAALRDALLPRLVSGQVGGGESELPTT